MEVMASLPLSTPLLLALGSSAAAQLTKFLVALGRDGRVNFKRLVELGGMPSAHSASVAALSTGVAIEQGFTSALFGVTAFFSLMTMYDAAGIRRSAGRQHVRQQGEFHCGGSPGGAGRRAGTRRPRLACRYTQLRRQRNAAHAKQSRDAD